MSITEPRCIICGAPLDKGAPFEKSVRKSEVCSDRCFIIYTYDEDNEELSLEDYLAELGPI